VDHQQQIALPAIVIHIFTVQLALQLAHTIPTLLRQSKSAAATPKRANSTAARNAIQLVWTVLDLWHRIA